MEEKSREQEMSAREISLIRELAQIRKEYKRELEYEKFDGYELPPRTQFSMLNKPAVSIKYGVMKFNMACIRLFEGIKYVLPILHPNKKRLALIMCPEEDSASVEWARQKDENWVNKDITSLEFVENIFKIMSWNRECRYKILGGWRTQIRAFVCYSTWKKQSCSPQNHRNTQTLLRVRQRRNR